MKKLLPPTGKAARFEDDTYTIGRIELGHRHVIFAFNFDDQPKDIEISLDGSYRVYDFWTDEEIGTYTNALKLNNLEPHCAKVLYYEVNGHSHKHYNSTRELAQMAERLQRLIERFRV